MSFQMKKEMTMKTVPKRERTEVTVVKISLAILRSSIFSRVEHARWITVLLKIQMHRSYGRTIAQRTLNNSSRTFSQTEIWYYLLRNKPAWKVASCVNKHVSASIASRPGCHGSVSRTQARGQGRIGGGGRGGGENSKRARRRSLSSFLTFLRPKFFKSPGARFSKDPVFPVT